MGVLLPRRLLPVLMSTSLAKYQNVFFGIVLPIVFGMLAVGLVLLSNV